MSLFSEIFGPDPVQLPPMPPMFKTETRYGSVPHKCPVCDGRGLIYQDGPPVPGTNCHACQGKGIVWSPVQGKEKP